MNDTHHIHTAKDQEGLRDLLPELRTIPPHSHRRPHHLQTAMLELREDTPGRRRTQTTRRAMGANARARSHTNDRRAQQGTKTMSKRYLCTNRYREDGVFKEDDVDYRLIEIPDQYGKLTKQRVAICPICATIAKEQLENAQSWRARTANQWTKDTRQAWSASCAKTKKSTAGNTSHATNGRRKTSKATTITWQGEYKDAQKNH